MRRLPAAAALCLLLGALSAHAHDADIIYARVSRGDGGAVSERVTLNERVTLTADTLGLLIPLPEGAGALTQRDLDDRRAALEVGVWDAMPISGSETPCAREGAGAVLREGYVELTARFRCPEGELRQTFRLLSILPRNYKVILASEEEPSAQHFAQGIEQTLSLPAPGKAAGTHEASPAGFTGWVLLGVQHIFTGYDHLCFLLALLLVGGTWRRVLWMVTSFTLAHSLTLGAVALGAVALDPLRQRWVELAIAASIIYVAVENLVRREHRHRAWVTFGFGLVHGFGFASVLTEYGLGQSVVSALLGFNLGVELGQACVVAVLFPLLRLLQRRRTVGMWSARVCSVAILVAGVFWLFERASG
jgi:hypothetical protein